MAGLTRTVVPMVSGLGVADLTGAVVGVLTISQGFSRRRKEFINTFIAANFWIRKISTWHVRNAGAYLIVVIARTVRVVTWTPAVPKTNTMAHKNSKNFFIFASPYSRFVF
jgi:hypothetical protein